MILHIGNTQNDSKFVLLEIRGYLLPEVYTNLKQKFIGFLMKFPYIDSSLLITICGMKEQTSHIRLSQILHFFLFTQNGEIKAQLMDCFLLHFLFI